MLSAKQIEIFYEVYRHASMTAAAQSLNISQPSISKTLRVIEKNLNFKPKLRIINIGKTDETTAIELQNNQITKGDACVLIAHYCHIQTLVKFKVQALTNSDMRLEERQQVAKREIRCDRDKAGRITEQLYYEHESAIRRLRCAVAKSRSNPPDVVMGVNAQENTSHDVSEVDKVIKMNMNLESKLKIANTARERAESRCALVVSELEAQKNDLIMLSAKLQRAEEKQANTSPCRSDALQVHLLRKSLSQRDAQLKGLRDSLVKLKADLVAVEQVWLLLVSCSMTVANCRQMRLAVRGGRAFRGLPAGTRRQRRVPRGRQAWRRRWL